MPARIVLATAGSYGDLFPYIGIARGLAARGHAPVLASSPVYRSIVERAGVAFRPVRPDLDPADSALLARAMHPTRGPEVVVREIAVPATAQALADLRPIVQDADLVVTHPITFAATIAADLCGRPWISSVLAPLSLFSAYDFPALHNAPWTAHVSRLGPWAGRLLMALGRRVTRDWTRPVRELRASLGLRDRGDPLFEGQFSPLGTLALFSPRFAAPQIDWPVHTVATGFAQYDAALTMPPELAAFLDAGDPPVVFTLGSSAVGAAGEFYRESVEAVKRLGLRAVLLVGDEPRNRSPSPLPPSIIEVTKAPHASLMPRARVNVHHGGIGTTAQALRAGKPMLVVPHSHDQPDNAIRSRRLGVARVRYPARYEAAGVAADLDAMVRDEGMRAQAEMLGRQIASEDGVARACEALEAALDRA